MRSACRGWAARPGLTSDPPGGQRDQRVEPSLQDIRRQAEVVLEVTEAGHLGEERTVDESDFTISFTVEESLEAVFAAIDDVREWWSSNIEGETDILGATFSYR